ncbi:hypothetical protein I7I48_05399 [Histoplasma ohiense]|nr:hypothetical protein I7I48_05399 [Histoplasma ohiense (nom. inval.)]
MEMRNSVQPARRCHGSQIIYHAFQNYEQLHHSDNPQHKLLGPKRRPCGQLEGEKRTVRCSDSVKSNSRR